MIEKTETTTYSKTEQSETIPAAESSGFSWENLTDNFTMITAVLVALNILISGISCSYIVEINGELKSCVERIEAQERQTEQQRSVKNFISNDEIEELERNEEFWDALKEVVQEREKR